MQDRKRKLLDYTIRNYIKTAQPVGSNLLVEKSGLGVSPATIRNELMELENEGYLFQPYTSAGRVPTEKGYRFWLENFYKERELNKKRQENLEKIKKQYRGEEEKAIKELAKLVADFSNSTVIVGFSPNEIYYTGISHLFSQPEFREYELICSISEVVDSLEEIIPELFAGSSRDVNILIGSDNPFSKECSVVTISFNKNSLFTILGPMRMDYEENVAALKFLTELI